MRLNLKTPPVVEPVSLDEVKLHLRIDGNEENSLLTALIVAARQQIENYCTRALITQTWEMILDEVKAEIEIPRPPLQAVSKIEVVAENGTKTEVSSALYDVDLSQGRPGRVKLRNGCTWPTHRGFASFIITFNAGYGNAAANVPGSVREAIKQYIAYLYEHRGDESIKDVEFIDRAGTALPATAQVLLQSYRIIRF